jgi:hypothetical protein
MSTWKRTTRKLDLLDIQIDRQRPFYKHISVNNLGSILNNIIMSVETESERTGGAGLGDTTVTSNVLLTPAWLMWVTRGDKTPPTANSARLETLQVKDYADSPDYAANPDSGLEISGIFTGKTETASVLIGLGDQEDARAFKAAVFKALENLKK